MVGGHPFKQAKPPAVFQSWRLAMLVIHLVDPARTLPVLWGVPKLGNTISWNLLCKKRGLLALAAEEDDELIGLAVAESHPRHLLILDLAGEVNICGQFLDRLVRLAGERNVAAYVPRDRIALQRLLAHRGFVRPEGDNRPERESYFFYLDRNEDVEG
jgi:hypothetical protein